MLTLALQRHKDERVPAAAKLVLQKGPRSVMDMTQERAPEGFVRPDDAIRYEELNTQWIITAGSQVLMWRH